MIIYWRQPDELPKSIRVEDEYWQPIRAWPLLFFVPQHWQYTQEDEPVLPIQLGDDQWQASSTQSQPLVIVQQWQYEQNELIPQVSFTPDDDYWFRSQFAQQPWTLSSWYQPDEVPLPIQLDDEYWLTFRAWTQSIPRVFADTEELPAVVIVFTPDEDYWILPVVWKLPLFIQQFLDFDDPAGNLYYALEDYPWNAPVFVTQTSAIMQWW